MLAFPAGSVMAEPVTLVVIGDSWTSGYSLAAHEGFVDRLEIWLRENGAPPVVIKNYTAGGLKTSTALALLELRLDTSVDAMIVQLGSSDNSVSIERGDTRVNLRNILELAQRNATSVLLVGAYATVHQTPAYRQEFDTLFPQLAAEAGALFYPSFFHVLGGQLSDVPPEYLLWDRNHPTAEAVRIIVDDIGPTVLKLIEGTNAAKEGN
ncbi:MAG: GDSL-type esterase/lipase family protein [Verrucomicrobia bacterium]|nr:GDSL-type esterase/lipase family protein [Verrucomicrobiota bacterium]